MSERSDGGDIGRTNNLLLGSALAWMQAILRCCQRTDHEHPTRVSRDRYVMYMHSLEMILVQDLR